MSFSFSSLYVLVLIDVDLPQVINRNFLVGNAKLIEETLFFIIYKIEDVVINLITSIDMIKKL